jgi:hypothetical protein
MSGVRFSPSRFARLVAPLAVIATTPRVPGVPSRAAVEVLRLPEREAGLDAAALSMRVNTSRRKRSRPTSGTTTRRGSPRRRHEMSRALRAFQTANKISGASPPSAGPVSPAQTVTGGDRPLPVGRKAPGSPRPFERPHPFKQGAGESPPARPDPRWRRASSCTLQDLMSISSSSIVARRSFVVCDRTSVSLRCRRCLRSYHRVAVNAHWRVL